MPRKKNKNSSLANPLHLSSLNAKDAELIQVVIETPKGSRNKYAFDPEQCP